MNQETGFEKQQSLDAVLEDIQLDKTLSNIKYKIIVLSGKGGVGKSTTAANLAVGLALQGKMVGLLDIDFHGPSIPKLLGLEQQKLLTDEDLLLPLEYNSSLKVMSLGLLLQSENDAVIWRGPMKMGAIKQLLKDVKWGALDYLIIDCPPGTGDEPLSSVQLLKNPTGAVVVTQPQDLSVSDVRRSIRFCEKLNLPVVGLIENMSGFVCPKCGEEVEIFKSGGGERLAQSMQVPFLGKIPIDPTIVQASDAGQPFIYFYGKSATAKKFEDIIARFIQQVESHEMEAGNKQQAITKNVRRYAVPVAHGVLYPHFGHCEQFALVDVDSEQQIITETQMKTPPPHEPGVLPRWLKEQNVQIILAGGMGNRAQSLFVQNGIQVVTGAMNGKPEDLVISHLKGELVTGQNVCDH